MRAAAVVLVCAACHAPAARLPSSQGAFHYRVDGMTVPQKKSDFPVDLNGDFKVDNQLGNIDGAMASQGWDIQSPVDMAFAQGRQQMEIEVRLSDTGRASATLFDPRGDAFALFDSDSDVDSTGAFVSPIIADRGAPIETTLQLAFLDDLRVPLTGCRLSFANVGAAEISAQFNGAMRVPDFVMLVYPEVAVRFTQLIAMGGATGATLSMFFDTGGVVGSGSDDGSGCKTTRDCNGVPRDWPACRNPPFGARAGMCADACDDLIDTCEVSNNSFIKNLGAPDVGLFDADGNWTPIANANMHKDAVSFGVGLHATLVN
jgi:hypothetical protein